ncbi:hypothetical protein LH935_06790 [Gordonia polyisoprenivorans]|uniref:hypothetical protein n=1 Tax=Gordonia polyisoprenivorans TaxID=84595 RepID=UPI002234492E|nr:hypothetical protein LH935_06790 [Gordonia polyisoprenivorans]
MSDTDEANWQSLYLRAPDDPRAWLESDLLAERDRALADLAKARNVIEQVRPALESLANVLAFSSRDWGQARDLAWLWGIVHGWDDEDHEEDSAMPEQARTHGWDEVEVARLRGLHAAYEYILADAEGSGQ